MWQRSRKPFCMAHRFARGSKERREISWQTGVSGGQERIKKRASIDYKSEVRLERWLGHGSASKVVLLYEHKGPVQKLLSLKLSSLLCG